MNRISRIFSIAICLFLFLAIFNACEKDEDIDQQDQNDDNDNDDNLNEDEYSLDHFYSGINTLELEVAYETGAEPIIESGGLLGSSPAWNLTKNNIEALFQGRNVETAIQVPLALSDMSEIPKQKQGDYSSADIKEIAGEYRKGVNEGNTGNIFVLFVDAYYSIDGERKEQVLGVAIGNTPYVAIFKPVINSIDGQSSQKNVEQATVIHEVGHALGLVDFGLPMVDDHKDDDHGAHCSNEDCVMYWTVANKSQVLSSIGLIQSNNVTLFGQECLNDSRNYTP